MWSMDSLNMYIPDKSASTTLHHGSQLWTPSSLANVTLDAAGLVALADLTTVARRTVYKGNSSLLDIFVLCPGLHREQAAPELNGGEYPACAAMTSGYVFRVENQATVVFLQKVGRTGQLTTIRVKESPKLGSFKSQVWIRPSFSNAASIVGSISYIVAVVLTMVVLILLVLSKDWWGLSVVVILMFARLCNVLVIRRRAKTKAWQGAREPGVQGDLLVLLSQDRWVRIKGPVDSLKAVTSGQWLEDPSFLEASVTAFATVLVYLDAALASNTALSGQILLLLLLFCSAGLLAIANELTEVFCMHGNLLQVEGERRKYGRRLEMADELIRETGRDDWALRLGMIVPKSEKADKAAGPVTIC